MQKSLFQMDISSVSRALDGCDFFLAHELQEQWLKLGLYILQQALVNGRTPVSLNVQVQILTIPPTTLLCTNLSNCRPIIT